MEQALTYGEALWKKLVILTSMITLAGCSGLIPEAEIKTVTKVEKVVVPVVARPKPLRLTDTRIFVVTKDNYDEFVKEFTEVYGDLAYVAISMKDYENLALNIAEMRRFLNQQKQIIVYYEKAVSENSQKNDKK
tara:strand:+ start:38 stop:439 length:402 start_codon:yes stop_codon:yes gene_type:complete